MALELLSKHENIIDYFKYFENDDSYNLILEHCSSGSIDTFMKSFKTMPIELVTYFTA